MKRLRKKEKKMIMLGVGFGVCVAAVVTFLILRSEERIEVDPITNCPPNLKQSPEAAVVLLDLSEPLIGGNADELQYRVLQIGSELKLHGKLFVVDIHRTSEPLIAICRPQNLNECDPVTAPRACKGVEIEYYESFERPTNEIVRSFLNEQSAQDYSPIVEAIRDISEITEFKEKPDGDKTIYIVSDMLQHSSTRDYSHYVGKISSNEYERFKESDLFRTNQPDLSGTNVEVLYLLRRKYRELQTQDHRNFWRTFFEESGVRNVKFSELNFFGGDVAPVRTSALPKMSEPSNMVNPPSVSESPGEPKGQTTSSSQATNAVVPVPVVKDRHAPQDSIESKLAVNTQVETERASLHTSGGAEVVTPSPVVVEDTAPQESIESKTAVNTEVERESTSLNTSDGANDGTPSSEKQQLEVGTEFKDCNECPTLVVVPAGSYFMGSNDNERSRRDNEGPRTRFTVSSLAVGKFEVTFDQWESCARGGGCNHYVPDSRDWGTGLHPVINVNWYDARGYTDWLGKKTGEHYRLPSEIEWEYFSRAGSVTPYWFGDSINDQMANYDARKTYGRSSKRGEFRRKTMIVGSFKPNSFGLMDTHGNVWEWTSTCWSEDITVQNSHPACAEASVKGGSWSDRPANLRSAFRAGNQASRRSSTLGFRVVRSL